MEELHFAQALVGQMFKHRRRHVSTFGLEFRTYLRFLLRKCSMTFVSASSVRDLLKGAQTKMFVCRRYVNVQGYFKKQNMSEVVPVGFLIEHKAAKGG